MIENGVRPLFSTGIIPVMYRLLIGPVITGILAFLFIYFSSPVIISESDIVAIAAQFALSLSNAFFENMPPIIVSYITNLNLAIVAITVGLSLTLVVQLLAIIGGMFVYLIRWIISYLQKDRKEEEPQDLPPIDMNSSFESSEDGKNILGRGLDSIDRD